MIACDVDLAPLPEHDPEFTTSVDGGGDHVVLMIYPWIFMGRVPS